MSIAPEFVNYTIEAARAHNERNDGAVEIEFRGAKIIAPLTAILDAIEFFRTELPARERKAYRREVLKQIDHLWDDVISCRASTDKAMLCCEDIGILFALDVFQGKATLPRPTILPGIAGSLN